MSYVNQAKKYGRKVAQASAVSMLPVAAFAQESGVDYSAMTSAVNWTAVIVGVGVIGVALMGVNVAKKGVRLLAGMVR